MKKPFLLAAAAGLLFAGAWAADHIDAPAVESTSSDITDFYAFESPENSENLVFVCNIQGLMDPVATASTIFDKDLMVEFNIDNTADNVEDLVIQAVFNNDKVEVYGPVAPTSTGVNSVIETSGMMTEADITVYNGGLSFGQSNGIKVFAGPRDDPFFMDFARYGEIIGGSAASFNDPGADTFAGTNVMSVVVEVPKAMLGAASTINTWVETKTK